MIFIVLFFQVGLETGDSTDLPGDLGLLPRDTLFFLSRFIWISWWESIRFLLLLFGGD